MPSWCPYGKIHHSNRSEEVPQREPWRQNHFSGRMLRCEDRMNDEIHSPHDAAAADDDDDDDDDDDGKKEDGSGADSAWGFQQETADESSCCLLID